MKVQVHTIYLIPVMVAAALVGAALLCGSLPGGEAPETAAPVLTVGTYQARVTEIIEECELDLGGHVQDYQVLRVQVLEGPWAEQSFELDYGRRQVRAPGPESLAA
jgi:hypothetical protein